jgi:hypothetical protein
MALSMMTHIKKTHSIIKKVLLRIISTYYSMITI